MRHLPNGATAHSDSSFERYIAPNLVNRGSTGSYGPRLGRRDNPVGFFWLGSFSALGTSGTSCFSRRFLWFFLRVSVENNNLGLDEGQFSSSFKWADSMSLWLAQKDPFVATLLDETENSVALSREQSSSSEGLLFSASEVEDLDKSCC